MAGVTIDKKSKVLVVALIVYNIALGISVGMLTTQPFIVLLFVSVDFFLIFYYILAVFREQQTVSDFEQSHAELIQKAREELKELEKSQQ